MEKISIVTAYARFAVQAIVAAAFFDWLDINKDGVSALSFHVVALSVHAVALSVHAVALSVHVVALSVHAVALSVHVVALSASPCRPSWPPPSSTGLTRT
eukprot:414974-Pyramimonas_sp.AAC.1